ncbi:MAG: hypothetical protein FLDDKLPJ_02593 [Phycisphaerae bacterium]|nr:hypothetical protein [Phycisphaerae bacterium]
MNEPVRDAGAEAESGSATSAPLWNNAITMTGVFIVVSGLILLITFGLFAMISPAANPYVDIVGLMVIPGVVAVGLVIAPTGLLLRLRKVRRTDPLRRISWRFPRIDLNDPRQRRPVQAFLLITFLMLPILGVSGYHGYHFTESSEFCGLTCHAVMEPQYAAYEQSPHARVACAECHIGSGAGWFVKAKLSGVRQVFAVWFDSYSKPIPPAISELRPARETCEECHWPAKFFGSQLRTRVHYSPDEANTRREVRMMVKTGGADPLWGRAEGIHWHMALGSKIEYVALDEELQEVPWVRSTDASGRERVYRSDGRPHDEPPPAGTVRTIDCMDCHNRAAHLFRPPYVSLDLYLDIGRIDASLPWVKREALVLLSGSYASTEEAKQRIAESLTGYYQREHPQVYAEKKAAIERSIEGVQDIYAHTFFPFMKVDWRTYPDNVGHMYSAGCFRCHDGKHFDADGQAISSACDVCHTFFNRVPGTQDTYVEGPFEHSMNLFPHPTLRCEQCHTGGPLPLCRECHASGDWLEEKDRERFQPPPAGP